MNSLTRPLWFVLGAVCVALGVLGIFLPLLPTTPFLLLAAFAFARSSPRVHDWLINHPTLGPPVTHWRRHGAITTRTKWAATGCIALGFGASLALAVPATVLAIQAVVLTGVGTFLWTRPTPPKT